MNSKYLFAYVSKIQMLCVLFIFAAFLLRNEIFRSSKERKFKMEICLTLVVIYWDEIYLAQSQKNEASSKNPLMDIQLHKALCPVG